ncbi:putative cytochrome P450 4d21 [Talaromyces islandicus]|uniref:Putative cytochrome P450 4d21 n=1 Tax=Talaromyces islandicus TaxID=28573 RepID=A0A0U1LLH2_TALIS|nr:putative cytochrome P450 4d21 [Talaromyces islandicus]
MVPWADGWSSATSIDKELHRSLRNTLLLGFNANSLKKFEPAILKQLEILMDKILQGRKDQGKWGPAMDMNSWNQWFALDMITDFGFGAPSSLLTNSADRYVLDVLHLAVKNLGVIEQWPDLSYIGLGHIAYYVEALTSFSKGFSLPIGKFVQWHQDFTHRAIINNTDTVSGVLGYVIQSGQGKLGRKGHNKPQMLAEGSFVTFTAADGIGTTLSAVMHYLAHYPRVYRKLAEELRNQFSKGDSENKQHKPETITWGPELSSCKYLQACLNEAWRLVPPACGVHWRECERARVIIGSDEMPVGSDVGVSLFTIFRSADYFRDARDFWPERWIKGFLPDAEYQLAKQVFHPFSLGTRSCAGSHAAVMIASVVLANVMVKYDFRPARLTESGPGGHGEQMNLDQHFNSQSCNSKLEFDSHFTLPIWKEGPILQFRERSPNDV